MGAIGGGIGAVVAKNEEPAGHQPSEPDHDDGPDWWTGYWALPRVVQHGGAVIMLSEFHDIQDFLAETGSHAWFPKSGFDRVVERRTSAYDDANFPLLDIGHIGPKGFWLFGKVVHPVPEGSTAEPEEGYVGVFSNKRPEWLTNESDPYDHRLEERIEKDGDDRIWKDAPDLFADKDWYVNGKNIWIVQVGSRTEFGSFETFMDRVSSARVHVDDTGDLECTYDVPRPGGGSDRLRLTNGDDAGVRAQRPAAGDRPVPALREPFRPQRGGRVGTANLLPRVERPDAAARLLRQAGTRCARRHRWRSRATRRRSWRWSSTCAPATRRWRRSRWRPRPSTSAASGPPPSRWSPPDRSARTLSTMPSGSSSTGR